MQLRTIWVIGHSEIVVKCYDDIKREMNKMGKDLLFAVYYWMTRT